jgi:RNA polymerase sigma factor (TIGR02999 family)
MARPSVDEVTQMLQAWGDGEERALDKLVPLVYDELHQVAHRYMAHQPSDHTLQTTALVNEVYVRLVNFREVSWQNRAHFLAVCARLMRHVLIDFARSRHYPKRGGQALHVSLDQALVVFREALVDLLALDDALNALAALDPRKGQVVVLRFFGGLSVEETAEVLKVSEGKAADADTLGGKPASAYMLPEEQAASSGETASGIRRRWLRAVRSTWARASRLAPRTRIRTVVQ